MIHCFKYSKISNGVAITAVPWSMSVKISLNVLSRAVCVESFAL